MNAMRGAIHLGRVGETAIDIHVTFIPVLIWAACLGLVQYGGVDGAPLCGTAIIFLFCCVLVHGIAHTPYAPSTCGFFGYNILFSLSRPARLHTPSNKTRDRGL